ncbi:MAG: RnfH family protein [Colwellia sp.]
MRISVAYALREQQWWFDIDVNEGSTVVAAIHKSGIMNLVENIQLESQNVGVFGKIVPLDTVLAEGDRVEIYRPVTWKPEEEDDDDD